ncbi:hypothetical protein [Yinghuangia seranimata]|uniref:hypothetical protein n=1 Tax=Yinghuangia seranimata TaxID=408067 RepID=UPI00248B4466|nr:hypothetical protein [Yinghuangia seranimata]MDI2127124.1 hypothetical protein [Yinghuangia seranimata]
MSLLVKTFVVGEDGKRNLLDVPEGSSPLAGFERWRTSVWGSEAVRSLGATFFPVLAGSDLTVMPDQVADFLDECALIRSNLGLVAPSTDPAKSHAEYVRQISERLRNVEDAAAHAQGVRGGVIIW